MDFGLDNSDPFGLAASFLALSLANEFGNHRQLESLFARLQPLEVPRLPNEPLEPFLLPIDRLLDEIEPEPGLLELISALVRMGSHTPPASESAQRLYRALLWVLMRHDPVGSTPTVLQIMRDATPGARPGAAEWPGHEFFAAVLVLVHLGGVDARAELIELLRAAQDLGYHDLAPVLAWYLDHPNSAPAR